MSSFQGNQIRDLIYFDFDKAASIWSQFEGGLLERVSIKDDAAKGRKAGVRLGIPSIAQADLGVDYGDKQSRLESRVLHHDLLNRLERELTEAGLIVDLIEVVQASESSPAAIRAAIGSAPYLKASGWSVIEDCRRILSISERFNEMTGFIGKCSIQAVKKTPEYEELQAQLESMKDQIRKVKDRNQKAAAKSKLKRMEEEIDRKLASQLSPVEPWILEGLRLWINTFMPNRLNFRIYPFEDCPSFHVICNLKRECFVDQDLEHLLYGYGNRPNVPLAVFGLITSLPPEHDELFDPMKEFEKEEALPDKVAMEKSFRALFRALDEMEAFARFSRYPNVTVHPIAVYRQFGTMLVNGVTS